MAAIVALECGWIVTEVGRQPWIVYQVMRTEDAVTDASGVLDHASASCSSLYAALGDRHGAGAAGDGAALARRPTSDDADVPYGPRPAPEPARGAAVSSADAVAGVLWVGVTLYAVFGGADFGAGFWDLVAGGGERGRAAARR